MHKLSRLSLCKITIALRASEMPFFGVIVRGAIIILPHVYTPVKSHFQLFVLNRVFRGFSAILRRLRAPVRFVFIRIVYQHFNC